MPTNTNSQKCLFLILYHFIVCLLSILASLLGLYSFQSLQRDDTLDCSSKDAIHLRINVTNKLNQRFQAFCYFKININTKISVSIFMGFQ